MTMPNEVHDDIRAAMDAANSPEVQEMIKKLAEYGLAVAVPHMHGQDGGFLPLPADVISLENGLKVEFVSQEEVDWESVLPVMWRWDEKAGSVVVAAGCGLECIVSHGVS